MPLCTFSSIFATGNKFMLQYIHEKVYFRFNGCRERETAR